jgi:TonB family protein
MFKARVTLLALPTMLALGQAAMASTVTLSLPSSRTQIAISGATCANPQEAARVTEPLLVYPLISQIAGREGNATVGIELSSTGHVARAWMVQSSDDANLDRGALETARASGYAPERQNCAAVGGRYLLNVVFSQ